MAPRRSIGTWTPTWKIQIRKRRKGTASTGALLSVSSMAALHSLLALVCSIFSYFHLLKCQILTSTLNRAFNGRSEEIPDSKIFPSSQTPAFYLPRGRITDSQFCFAFPRRVNQSQRQMASPSGMRAAGLAFVSRMLDLLELST